MHNANAKPLIAILEDSSDKLDSGKLNAGGTKTGKVPLEADAVFVGYYGNIFADEPVATWVLK